MSSSAIHKMPSLTKYSFTISVGCDDAERISCRTTESWKLQSVASPLLENLAATLYHKLSIALHFLLMSPSHVLNQHSFTCTKNILFSSRPTRIVLRVSAAHDSISNILLWRAQLFGIFSAKMPVIVYPAARTWCVMTKMKSSL